MRLSETMQAQKRACFVIPLATGSRTTKLICGENNRISGGCLRADVRAGIDWGGI